MEAEWENAVRLLEAGEIVALPTETVYGLAADALNPRAVAKIFEAKERPFFDPLICHLPNQGWLERMAEVPPESRALLASLTAEFWPGPLTVVLPRRAIVPDLVTAGLETVALRLSAHPIFAAIVEKVGRPLAAPSANRFGRISPTTAAHVRSELGSRVPLVVDSGPAQHGLESTIVALEGGNLRLLRRGPITREQLSEFAPWQEERRGSSPEAPGQMASHYAPRTPLVLELSANSTGRVGLLAWTTAPEAGFAAVETLSATGDLREAAATLFAKMRRLDEAGLDLIVAQPVPEFGLGAAIMDRLRKAAGRG